MKYPILIFALYCLIGCSTNAQTIEYDEFAALQRADQVRVFSDISPENRAALARTQAELWLTIYRDSLSQEQIATTEDAIASIDSELYGDDPPPGRAERLESRLLSALPIEFVRLAFGEVGTTPPPPSPRQR